MLKAAIIGLGHIAWGLDKDPGHQGIDTHARAYSAHPKIELVAACDLNPATVSDFVENYTGVAGYTDFHDMMKRERPDIVSVCTPTHLHASVVTAIAPYAPRVIVCEKPIAFTLNDAATMVTECLHHDVELIINHTRRFDVMHQQIALAVQNGLIGKLTGGNIYYTSGVFNTGSHIFDLIRLLVGEVSCVQAFIESSIEAPDPTIGGRLIFGEKVNMFMHAIDVKDYLMFEIDLIGSLGRIQIRNSGDDCELYLVKDHETFTGYKALQSTKNPFASGMKNMMLAVVSHAVDVVLNNAPNMGSGSDALRSLEVILALRKSYDNGGEIVRLSGAKKKPIAATIGGLWAE